MIGVIQLKFNYNLFYSTICVVVMPKAKSMNLIGRQMQNWADAVWAAFYRKLCNITLARFAVFWLNAMMTVHGIRRSTLNLFVLIEFDLMRLKSKELEPFIDTIDWTRFLNGHHFPRKFHIHTPKGQFFDFALGTSQLYNHPLFTLGFRSILPRLIYVFSASCSMFLTYSILNIVLFNLFYSSYFG